MFDRKFYYGLLSYQQVRKGGERGVREREDTKLLTPEEAAERLNVSPVTIRKWLRTGKLRGVKVSVLWRVKESDLNDFIENRRSGRSEEHTSELQSREK